MEKTVELSVLWRSVDSLNPFDSGFDLRLCNESDADLLRQVVAVDGDPFGYTAGTLDMLGEPRFFTVLATKCGQPAATGSLYIQNELGYLGNGKTLEVFRRQGAQNALIATRVSMAAALGCLDVVSETYRFLESSYRNLIRAGFVELYARSIYRWEA
jgi:hypothetical protein